MQIDINVKTYSAKQRILAFVMAFLIFTMTCPELFEGWGIGLVVHAADIHVASNDKTSTVVSTGSTADKKGDYWYTGKYSNNNTVTLFDYLTDYEIKNGYNNCNQVEAGYCDPYTRFNNAISHNANTILYSASDNVTIEFQAQYRTESSPPSVYVNYWDDSTHGSGFNQMTFFSQSRVTDSGTNYYNYVYRFTFNKNQTIGNLKLSDNDIKHVQFRIGADYYVNKYQDTSDNNYTIHNVGRRYIFNNYNNGTHPAEYFAADATSVADVMYNGNSTNFTAPLYFGAFIMDFNNSSYASRYTDNRRPSYNNFYWQANMGLKGNTGIYDSIRGSASMQGLVYSKLSGTVGANYTGDLLDKSATTNATTGVVSGTALPYFSTSWAGSHSDVMKYYTKDNDNTGNNIAFPFYETYKAHNGSSTVFEKYYQFDSKYMNLIFDYTTSSSASGNTGHFKESNTQIKHGDNPGFFPFNSDNGSDETKHNLGFGQKIVMDFQLEEDGCVNPVQKVNGNSKELEEIENSTERIHTIFEFTGDDDLWVFIDGNLVLDMGGDHDKSTGRIDFAARTATVERASVFGATSSSLTGTSYNALDAMYQNNRTVNNIHQLLSEGSYVNTDDGIRYTKKTHTMTIFYMERGMMDSNLMIRYNYTPINNSSKMKIAEVTRFDDVNDGLLALTKAAAEDDVFKYTVQNTNDTENINTDDIMDSGAKFPTTTTVTRTGETGLRTQMTPNGTDTPTAAQKFSGTAGYVTNTGYWWVDKTVSPSGKMVGKTTSNGELWLKYGTDDAVYSADDGLESSAEFEKQFTRNTKMTIKQGKNIYRLARSGSTTPTLFNTSNQIQATETSTRAVSDFYTTQYRLVDRDNNTLFNEDAATYNATGTGKRNSSFLFSNDASLPATYATQLTEYVENTVRTGTLTIQNTIINKESPNEEFTYTIKLYNVFGVGGDVSNYTNLSATKLSTTSSGAKKTTSTSSEPVQVMTNGSSNNATFTLKDGQKVVITGIPLGTTYHITETGKTNVDTTVEVNSGVAVTGYVGTRDLTEIIVGGNATTDHLVAYVNNRSIEITAEKTNGKTGTDKEGLEGAELDLYIREKTNPPTYSFNEPKKVPTKTIENKIPSSDINIPNDEVVTTAITIPNTTISYGSDTPPTASDSDWILPRNDSDYIYFRDYNDAAGTNGNYLGTEDKSSFGTQNVAWRETFFANSTPATASNPGTHSQNQEIGFADEAYTSEADRKYPWVAAQFTKNNGQDFVEYAVWERFVDDYNGKTTVVWKIQPPDGYTEVRFCMYYGDQCIRTTKRFNFELGKIYHKTNWGSKYEEQNGEKCYWNVPVTSEETSNDHYWAPEDSSVSDKRMTGTIPGTSNTSYTGTMAQARKYEPTDQKVIFYCNSQQVWHNIHIEFFDVNGERVNGQPFPGYMMEPYAYAESNYRLADSNGIEHYLTYELTIPKNAKSFRINNGIDNSAVPGTFTADDSTQSPYAYRTNIQVLNDGSTTEKGKGVKNYGNYYVLNDDSSVTAMADCQGSSNNPKEVTLIRSVSKITDLSGEDTSVTYDSPDVDSDYDYIYFEKPDSTWGDHIYAYFYGGGNLRSDNWQRACYSAWPGVAAAGTEYTDNTTAYYSTTYNYPAQSNQYNGTENGITSGDPPAKTYYPLSPETTFTNSNGKTVYKFRIPKGDRKNYSKVIFNNGLSSQNGGQETGVIEYYPGYLYKADGSPYQHYDEGPTDTYPARSNTSDDYIYVKIDITTAATWDDPHITFYDNHGRQILQGGHGYVMDYAGTKHDDTENKDYQYYRVPIPADSTGATRFKINNGISRPNETTDFYEILKYGAAQSPIVSKDYTTGKLVYKLSGTSLTRTEPTFAESSAAGEIVISVGNQNAHIDYNTRGDKLKILDDASPAWVPVTSTGDGIGKVKVRFYDDQGTLVSTTSDKTADGAGTYTLIQSEPDANGDRWYTIDIPQLTSPRYVKHFTLTYPNGTTAPYEIYKKVGDVNANGATGNRTQDGMYYHTKSDGTLELIASTVQSTNTTDSINDETYSKRGDNLYLVTSQTMSNIKVVFYGEDGTAFQTDENAITAKFVADEQVDLTTTDHWYKVSIPNNAVSFKVIADNGDVVLQQADIYELKSKISRYKENYTLGDMQYRITDSTDSAPTLLYPVFTKNDEYTIDVGGNTISSNMAVPQVDESAVAGYSQVGVTPATSGTEPDGVVLYVTQDVSGDSGYIQDDESSNISKKWGGSGSTTTQNVIYFKNTKNWDQPYIYLWNNSTNNGAFPGQKMTQVGTSNIWQCDVAGTSYTKCIFSDGTSSNQTDNITLPSDLSEKGKIYQKSSVATVDTENIYVQQPSGGSWNDTYATFYHNNTVVSTVHTTGSSTYTTSEGHTINNVHVAKIPTTGDPNKVMFHNNSSPSSNNYSSEKVTFTAGHLYTVNSGTVGNSNASGLSTLDGGAVYVNNWGWDDYIQTSATYTATYQPEDRYGYISNINGSDDINNFIYIDVSPDSGTDPTIADPYVTFYNGSTLIQGVKDGSSTTSGIKADPAGTENLYRIRLPKYATSFTISNGPTDNSPSAAYDLVKNLTVKVSDGQPYSGNYDRTTIENFHHAGSTFHVSSGKEITLQSVRNGYTINKDESMADPLNPKTDSDFVYLTDSTGNFASGGAVYAYFYGDVDGAYTDWPGVKAMTPNTGVADTTYTDNNGKKVYVFRIPKGSEGKYSKVIFTDGVTTTARKVTVAQNLTGGTNYVLDTNSGALVSSGRNGAFSTFAYTATAVEASQKSSLPTIPYSTNEAKTIYFVNTGTPDSVSNSTVSRTPLDDVHVVFYDENEEVINHADGYKPDKVIGSQYNNTDVYKIVAPDSAAYFQITNGTGKGSAGGKERHSEIKKLTDKGLYQFVTPSDVTASGQDANTIANYIEESSFNNDKSKNTYLLGLANKREEGDEELPKTNTTNIKIATIVTGANGTQEYIKWLKPDPSTGSGVDTNYLQLTDTTVTPPVNKVGSTSPTSTTIKLAKAGDYYWVESKAPTGYTKQSEETDVPTGETSATVGDDDITGNLKLVKEYAEGMPSSLSASVDFPYTVTLTAPSGMVFTLNNGTIGMKKSTAEGNGTPISVKKFAGTVTNGEDDSYTSPSVPSGGATATFTVNVQKAAYVVVENLPYNTQYSVNEGIVADWIKKGSSGTSGKITSADTFTASYTNAKVEPLTISKTVVLEGVDNPSDEYTNLMNTTFTFTVKLSNTGLSLSDYNLSYSYNDTNVTAITPAANTHPTTFTVTLKNDQAATINGIPVGTQYQVSETGNDNSSVTWKTSYQLTGGSDTDGNESPYTNIPNNSGSTAAFTNKYKKLNTVDLDLKKSVNGALPKSIKDISADPYYKFTITLTQPNGEDFSDYDIKINGTATSITSGTAIYKYLNNGDTLSITGLPKNTQYFISEDTTSFYANNDGTGEHTYASVSVDVPTIAPSGGASATLTESKTGDNAVAFTNTYPSVHDLVLQKTITGTPPESLTGKYFRYTVTLTPTSTIKMSDYPITRQVGDVSGPYPEVSYNESSPAAGDAVTYYVYLQGNQTVTLHGIPAGTKYKVTEDQSNYYTYNSSTEGYDFTTHPSVRSGSVTGEVNDDNHTIATSGNASSVNITNPYPDMGKLKLTKEVVAGSSQSQAFTYTVTLTTDNSTGIDLTKYIKKTTEGSIVKINGVAVKSANEPTAHSVVFTVDVTHGTSVTFDGIPAGTHYEVSEALPDTSWSEKSNTTTLSGDIIAYDSNNESTTVKEAKFVNVQKGNLILQKRLAGGTRPTNKPNNAGTYTFNVTFTDTNSIGIGDYTITKKVNGNSADTFSATSGNHVITIKADEDVTLEGIPYGVQYSVTEDSDSMSGTVTDGVTYKLDGTDKPSGISNETIGATQTVTVTNTYPDTHSLKVKKAVAPSTLPAALNGIDSNTTYTIHVVLTAPSSPNALPDSMTLADYPITYTKTGDSTVYTPADKTSFDITLKGGQTATIINIPDNTEYNVTETNVTSISQTSGVVVTDNSATYPITVNSTTHEVTNGKIDANTSTVTVQNTYYSTGNLVLSKSIEPTGTGAVYPTGKPETYKFHVELTPPSGATLLGSNPGDTLGYKIEKNTGTNHAYVTVGSLTESNGTYSFDVDVTPGDDVTIQGIPFDTTYKVTEDNDSKKGTSAVSTVYTDDSEKKIDNATNDKVTITNTYPNVGSLELKKVVEGNNAPAGVTSYTFKVTLEAPKDSTNDTYVELDNYDIKYTDKDGNVQTINTSTYTGGHKYTDILIDVPVCKSPDNKTITIKNIPYDTKYTVVEDTSNLSTIPNVGYSPDSSGKSEGTIGSRNLVTVTNAYTNTYKLTLKKSLNETDTYAAKYGVDENTKFKYHVTLTDASDSQLGDDVTISVSGGKDNSVTSDQAKAAGGFDVYVTTNSNVVIDGLPGNAKYTVSEVINDTNYGKGTYLPAYITPSPNDTGSGSINSNNQTVTITNEYHDTQKLILKKMVSGSWAVGDMPSSYDFTVKLTEPSDKPFSDYNVTGVTISNPDTTDGHVYTFNNVSVNANGTLTIDHLPVGTKYEITENALNDGSKASIKVDETSKGEVRKTGADCTISDGEDTVEITNTYPEKGKIELKKANLEDNAASLTTRTQFDFEVVLKPPAGMSLETFAVHYLNLTGWTTANADSYTYPQDTSLVKESGTPVGFKVTKSCQAGNDTWVEITNLPYGTTYTVTETDDSQKKTDFVTYSIKRDSTTTTSQTSTISATNQVTVTNRYPDVGKLKLIKSIADGSSLNGENFTFVVTLTPNSNMDATKLKEFVGSDWSLIESNTKLQKSYTISPVSGTDSSFYTEISGIPVNTGYSVTETPATGWTQVGKEYGNNDHKIGATGNTYTATNAKTNELTLTKALADGTPDTENSKLFLYEVVLTAPDGMKFTKTGGNATGTNLKLYIQNSTNGVTSEITINPETVAVNESITQEKFYNNVLTIPENGSTATFKVHLSESMANGRKIKGLPYGTVYAVTEDTDHFPTPATSGTSWKKISPDTAPNGTINSNGTYTATITNGLFTSLTLNKDFVNKPFNVTLDKTFTFDVTLTKTGLTKVKVDETEQNITSGTAFQVDVSKNNPVTITDIPVGTTYKVEETAASQTGVQSVNYSNSANTTQTISTPANVTVTNTYEYVNKKITLFKRDAETGEGIPGGQFYLLKLADDLDITDDDVQNTFKTGSLNESGELKYGDKVLATVVTGTGGVLTTQSNPDDNDETDDEDHAAGNLPVTEKITGNSATEIKFTPGEKYFFFENTTVHEGTTILSGNTPISYKADNTITEEKVITILANQDYYTVTYDNERTPTSKDVEIEKQDKTTGEKLGGAKFELWYKNVEIPTTYTVNNAANPPDPLRATAVTGILTVPEAATGSYKTPDTPTYSYSNPAVPSAEEVEWILPRTDNDYIYFRDYNDATTGYTGTQDYQSFNAEGQDSRKQTNNRSWIYTTYETNTHGQDEEIHYNHDYWIAAWFSGPGKETVRYSVWERFLDTYTTGEDTVIWKIQPPDGYTKVRFGLFCGSNCVRTTEEFKFKLGTVYHKTSYGTWKRENGNECYFDAPVVGEKYWSTYYDKSGTADKRQDYANITDKLTSTNFVVPEGQTPNQNIHGAPQQADRYTPTEQKVVFHCNSKVVWHNIHIEFFEDAAGTKPVGQTFPGYLMEPYSYAGDNYRVNGYLTYELTIPKEARYFRVNNGIDSGHYQFRSEITPLLYIEGRKNYGNYFSINGAINAQVVNPYNDNANTLVHLDEWTNYTATGDSWTESYDSIKLDSDCDFVYFEKPAGWSDHVYAYFYGGGDLRKDNWQRATYSVWPGVAPVSTEYVEKDTNGTVTGTYHSDTYDYTYTGNLYHSTHNAALNPESTFIRNGKVIYKFRIPKGERKNYSHVIFNDGLSNCGGTDETGVIRFYSQGHLYDKDGTDKGYYYNKPTYDYSKRGNGDDYIYIRTNTYRTGDYSSYLVWDNMHIRFYDSNRAILQDKSVSDTAKGGYVMEYSGTLGGYKYFKIPIPENATEFSLNNGRDGGLSTGRYEILRLDTNGDSDNTANDYTKDRMIFEVDTTNNTLNRVGPIFTAGTVIPGQTITTGQNAHIDYTVRQSNGSNDTLNIRDTAGWNLGTTTTTGENPATITTISAGSIKFYDENGHLITGDSSDGKGTYTLIKTKVESSEQNTAYTPKTAWYTIGIPENAKTFTVSYTVSTKVGDNDPTIQNIKTPAYEIYPYGASGTEADHTESGNMYYETTSANNNGQLQLISDTVTNLNAYTEPTYLKRGDDLYLVCADKSAWQGMTVTFTFDNNTTLSANAQYLNYVSYEPLNPVAGVSTSDMNEVGYWFRVAIPKIVTGAEPNQVTTTPTSFKAVKDDNSAEGAIFRLTDTISRYDNDYTTKNMMYRLPNASGKPKLIYPVYTKEEVQSVEVGGETIYSESGVKANERDIAEYAKSESAKLPQSDATTQTDAVLYETDTKDITTTWTAEGTNADYDYIKLMDRNNFGDFNGYPLRAYFFNGTTDGVIRVVEPEDSVETISDGTVDRNVYKFKIPSGNFRSVFFTNRIVSYSNDGNGSVSSWKQNYPDDDSNSRQTHNISLIGYGHGFIYATRNQYKDSSNNTYNSHDKKLYPTFIFGMTNSEATLDDKLYVIGFENYSQMQAQFDGSTDYNGSPVSNVATLNSSGSYNGGSYNGSSIIAFDKPDTYDKVRIHDSDWNPKTEAISQQEVDNNVGKALCFSSFSVDKYYEYQWIQLYQTTGDHLPYNAPAPVSANSGNATYTATYQPEDRYDDDNNYIYIETGSTNVKPYVMFYDAKNGGENKIGGIKQDESAVSVGVKAEQIGETSKYRVRLPKNAKSFKVANGPVAPTATAYNLYDNVSYTTAGGETITLEDYHHAGSTFWIKSDCTVDTDKDTDGYKDGIKLRTGFTVGRNTSLTDPLNPRTDGDYVFFTDTTDTFASYDDTNTTVYAYFYGDADGEFKAWPGSKATTTTSGNYDVATGVKPSSGNLEPTTYTDNNGKKVYMFRVPQGENGTYSKVIFSNGLAGNNNKITKALDLVAGKNYVLGDIMTKTVSESPRNVWYAETFAKNVYDVTVEDKANGNTRPYSTSGNKYIYIINNGTQDTTTGTTPRTTLDEMHVTFYDSNKQIIGSANGYIPDLVTGYYKDEAQTTWQAAPKSNVYRILIPSDASYFQINNGVNKGGTSKLNERYSVIEEIAENGLYQFVESVTESELIESGTFPTAPADKHIPKYKLTLTNKLNTGEVRPVRTEYIRLAEVVSDDTPTNLGKIKKITWLKPEEGHESDNPQTTVDTNYLNHTVVDINNPAVHQVKVIKKGTYYWKETDAPTNYKLNEEHLVFEYKDDGVYYYDENNNLVKVDEDHSMVIANEPNPEPPGEVILTKTAKEKVGTTDIGDTLAGAEFKLVDKNNTSSEIKFKLTQVDPDTTDTDNRKTNIYTVDNSGSYNVSSTNSWLATGEDGKLHIKGLSYGDYYLEEQKAPKGYSEIDSTTGEKRKIYFSVGENREVKEISAADEMAPAYIRLFEHIDTKKEAWGNPTFIFKIKQTQHYEWVAGENDTSAWQLNGTDDTNGKEIVVALTVNDNGKITAANILKWYDNNAATDKEKRFETDPINNELYGDWFVEATSEDEYIGLFNIDEQGRIRVEPGKYEVTRLPVSRYEYVTSGHIVYGTDPTTDPYSYDTETEENPFQETAAGTQKVTIAELKGGETADVHYYDKVGYYDKFSQVTEQINSLHRYTDENDAKQESIKGIRIADYHQKGTGDDGDTNATTGDMTIKVADLDIYKIFADGTEEKMTTDEKNALTGTDFIVSYTAETGDFADFADSTKGFSYNDQAEDANNPATYPQIIVKGTSAFKNGVYTLDADYKGFKTSFDVVFERT